MWNERTGKEETLVDAQRAPDGSWVKWWTYDEDVLEVMRMLVAYLGRDAEEGRAPVTLAVVRRAASILGVRTHADGDYQGRRRRWYLGKRWRERLETAGIDPETLEVKNRQRWALSWTQIKGERRGKYYPEKVENAYRAKWYVDEGEAFEPMLVIVSPDKGGLKRASEKAEKEAQVQADYVGQAFKKHVAL